jgi:hypothetical protein
MKMRDFWMNLGSDSPDGIDFEECGECHAPMTPREAVDEDGCYIVWECHECSPQTTNTETQTDNGTTNTDS